MQILSRLIIILFEIYFAFTILFDVYIACEIYQRWNFWWEIICDGSNSSISDLSNFLRA